MLLLNMIVYICEVLAHKCYVARYCFKAGLYWRGITHDLSRFSWTEMYNTIRDNNWNSSYVFSVPANTDNLAWLHHKSHNTHHPEYWVDISYDQAIPLPMPLLDSLEMLCDCLGALDEKWSCTGTARKYKVLWDWWKQEQLKHKYMHPGTRDFISLVIDTIKREESIDILKHRQELEQLYVECLN